MLKKILSFVSSIFVAAGVFFGVFRVSVQPAFAAGTENAMDISSVEDDLGENFDWSLYPQNKKGDFELLQFVEYCYTDDLAKKSNYALYLYVYNPAEIVFSPNNNVVNMAVSYKEDGSPDSYEDVPLRFCDYSNGDYAFRIYKYRIDIPKSVYTNAWNCSQKSGYRQYDIAGIQLRPMGDLLSKDNFVSRTFKCTGYAKGYDESSLSESTYECLWDDLETVSLDVHPTYYRPDGSNEKSEWHQDSLHSVYFAVPNKLIDKYGSMYAVHATWLNAVLAPMLVTGNYDAFSAISAYLGKELPVYSNGFLEPDLYYSYFGACRGAGSGYSKPTIFHGYSYNGAWDWTYDMRLEYYGEELNNLYFMYYSGLGVDSADEYIVPSVLIKDDLASSFLKYGGDLIDGKYSSRVFSSIDSEFTDVNITADEKFDLIDRKVDKSWWSGLFGFEVADKITESFNSVQAIQAVSDNDLKVSDSVLAQQLYISEGDCEEFRSFYNKNKDSNTIYLFRYQVSDYISQEATLYFNSSDYGWRSIDTNAYFFQETVNLSFDIIDLTFTKDGLYTVIPVVASPIDVIHDGTPPLNTNSDKEPNWMMVLIGLIILIIIVIVIIVWGPGIITFALKGLWSIILWPFKKIGQAVKSAPKKRKRRKR